ncbi:MAG: CPBP family intramembrane metalloprotease [Proteobacteria bacterium]|nr:MAG: CPBP family intramembrane metalloprotease [Pseudomonadota bacterium]QKK10622.1 MAG: CPBP family intramembrane metalloprotease [Pseudomonadota bacterium]
MVDSSNTVKPPIPFSALIPFLLIAFGLAWGIVALFIVFPDRMTAFFGEISGQHPLFFLAVYAPAIAAFIIVIYHSGANGLRRFLTRLFLWRCAPLWYVFLVVGVPLLFYGGAALKGNLFAEPIPFAPFQALLIALLLAAIKGPVEEFGWRGLALPLLQRRFTPLWAALILGIVWGFWHLPAFLLSGTQQSAWSFTPFFAGTIAVSVIMTALFNASRGSILLAAVMHFQLINPIWPDAQPYDTLFFVAAAVVIVWFNREAMLTGVNAVTEVIPTAGPAHEVRAP